MKWLSGLFGGSESAEHAVKRAADGIYNGLDKIVYTDEEKAEAQQKAVDTFMAFVTLAYDQNSIRSVTRRWLAFMVVGPFTLLGLASGLLWPWFDQYAEHLSALSATFAEPSMWVLGFYFGAHIVRGIIGKKE